MRWIYGVITEAKQRALVAYVDWYYHYSFSEKITDALSQ